MRLRSLSSAGLFGVFLTLVGCVHPQSVTPQAVRSVAPPDAEEILRLEQESGARDLSPAEANDVQWKLVAALERSGLLNLAFTYALFLARASHHHRVKALETLVRLQELRQDDFLIPSFLENVFREADPPVLSKSASERVLWLRARIALRRGELAQAVSLSSQIPPDSTDFARAQYVKAVSLADERLDGGRGRGSAIAILEALAARTDGHQESASEVRAQALLALGRLSYARRQWSRSVDWYERAAKLPQVRADALFEQSLGLIQQGAWGDGLTILRSDEVRASGNPEVALVDAMASHFSGDAVAAERSLARAAAPQPTADVDGSRADAALASEAFRTGRGVSAQALRIARQNRRLRRLFFSIESFENELVAISRVEAWKGTPLADSFTAYLTQNLGTLQLVAARLSQSEFREQQTRAAFAAGMADVIGIEVALARRDLDAAIERAERVLLSQMPEKGPTTSEMVFRLMALKQARAEVLKGAEADETKAQVALLRERIVSGDPTFERLEEARRFLDGP